jgi:hypothetical protein
VIECGPHATGGNFSGFRSVADLAQPGFPIAEIAADGSSVITKDPGTGGAVTEDTVTAQLVYEIGEPAYLNPDVSVTERASVSEEPAAELLLSIPELAREIAEHLYVAVPELAALDDEEIVGELPARTAANIRQVLWLLKRGAGVEDVMLPLEAASFMRHSVRRGIPLPVELARLPARACLAVGPLGGGPAVRRARPAGAPPGCSPPPDAR